MADGITNNAAQLGCGKLLETVATAYKLAQAANQGDAFLAGFAANAGLVQAVRACLSPTQVLSGAGIVEGEPRTPCLVACRTLSVPQWLCASISRAAFPSWLCFLSKCMGGGCCCCCRCTHPGCWCPKRERARPCCPCCPSHHPRCHRICPGTAAALPLLGQGLCSCFYLRMSC